MLESLPWTSPTKTSKLRAIWEKEFREKISADQARIDANNVMEVAYLIARPLPGEPEYREPKPDNPSQAEYRSAV